MNPQSSTRTGAQQKIHLGEIRSGLHSNSPLTDGRMENFTANTDNARLYKWVAADISDHDVQEPVTA